MSDGAALVGGADVGVAEVSGVSLVEGKGVAAIVGVAAGGEVTGFVAAARGRSGAGVGVRVAVGSGWTTGLDTLPCGAAAVGVAAGGAVVGDGVGVAWGITRGLTGTAPSVSTGPCTCGVAVGVGEGSKRKPPGLAGAANAGAASAIAIKEVAVLNFIVGFRMSSRRSAGAALNSD